jgi:hypothetical protein
VRDPQRQEAGHRSSALALRLLLFGKEPLPSAKVELKLGRRRSAGVAL